MAGRSGWIGFRHRQFDISNGCRNHTLLPYAARLRQTLRRYLLPDEAPYQAGFSAVRLHAGRSLTGKARPATTLRADAAASTASQPAFVTMANAPCRVRRAESHH